MKSLRQQHDDSLINEPQGSKFHLPSLTSEASTDLSCWRTHVKTLVHIRREDSWVLFYIVPAYQNSLLCDFALIRQMLSCINAPNARSWHLDCLVYSQNAFIFCFSPLLVLSRPLVIVSPEKKTKNICNKFCLHRLLETWSFVCPPADDMDAVPVKHFIKHVMELYKNNLQGFSEEFEVISVPFYWRKLLRRIQKRAELTHERNEEAVLGCSSSCCWSKTWTNGSNTSDRLWNHARSSSIIIVIAASFLN